ncbi:hypothetical protein [Acaryochloris sp. IP29b_bin.137]|uniref:hypothetical protein n=1 Tax=Acaryochloris sp. IP29b_bin.137 TaxID=2969217 RepID=UPI0026055A53|nr:hypothetical protein [Acaryochloris sp. IP29b_bin.137]
MTVVRTLVRLICGATTISILGIWLYVFAPITAPWVEFGYYGKFNQVRRIIQETPNLTIIDQWQHRDITLEDFGFTVRRPDGSTVQINFYERSEQMKLSSDDDIRDYIVSSI